MSENDVLVDYELSGLYQRHVDKDFVNGNDNIKNLIAQINDYEGDTFQKRVENTLLDMGITAEEISSVREIFV